MKVFTVGLDEKPPIKDEKECTKPEPLPMGPPVPPMISIEKKNRGYKGYLMCMLTVFFILLFAIILSELAYNRARDENYLRLRWAELKHRMAVSMGWGCDGCMNNNNNNKIYTSLPQQQQQPIVPESLYRHDRIEALPFAEMTTEPTTTTTTTELSTTSSTETTNPDDSPKISGGDPRLEFLRQILTKIREEAEKAGIDGTMQISLIRVDPSEMNQDSSSSSMDGFGDFHSQILPAMTPMRRILMPWTSDEFYGDSDESPQIPDFMASRRVEFMGPQMPMPAMGAAPGASPMMGPSVPFSAPNLPQMFMMNRMMMQNIPQAPMMPPQAPMMPSPLQASPMMGMPQPQPQPQPQIPLIDRPWFGTIPGMENDNWLNPQNTWQASLERNNEWNVQRAGIADNLDQRMSQAVSQMNQDQSPWWNNQENQWNSNEFVPQQAQPQWPNFFFKPMEQTGMEAQPQPQTMGMAQQQQQLQQQQQQQQQQPQQQQQQPQQQPQQQQQPFFFFPQTPFGGNMNNQQFNGQPQFPAQDLTDTQQSQQQQQPQQQQQSLSFPAPSAAVPQVPVIPQIMSVEPVQPDVPTPIIEAVPQPSPVVAGSTPDLWARPEQSIQVEPSNDALKGDQVVPSFIPQFFQIDEPRHVDQEGMLE